MKKHSLIYGTAVLLFSSLMTLSILPGCEGPEGLAGVDANETCKQCHTASVVGLISTQYELSKHSYGEAAFEEAGSNTCGPCHLSESFKYVVENNVASTFTLNATTSKYVNDYYSSTSSAFGEISCFTCHSNLHVAYDTTDFYPLTTTAPVALTMWAGAKTVNLTQDEGTSNLCVKCHQPRPFTASNTNGAVLDYAALVSAPTTVFYDSTASASATNKIKVGYRTHPHYGTVGAIFAGVGGVEFAGSVTYANSPHASAASCQDCHMAPMTGKSGGHTFGAKGNFNGCNTADCHGANPITSTSTAFWTTPRAATKTLLNTLAGKLKQGGVDFLNRNGNSESNLWLGLTTNNYDGYMNVYDPLTNPDGATYNTGGMFRNASPSSSWSAEQKAYNLTLPKMHLKNVQMGAIINFQMCLRDYSLGIHNGEYTTALLQNSIDALTAAGL